MPGLKSFALVFSLVVCASAGLARGQEAKVMANPHDLLEKRPVLGVSAQGIEELYLKSQAPMVRGLGRPSQGIADYVKKHRVSQGQNHIQNAGFAVPVDVIHLAPDYDQYQLPSLSQLRNANGQIDGPILVPAQKKVSLHTVWELVKNERGDPVLRHRENTLDVIPIRVGMVIGGLGRVVALKDTEAAYSVLFTNGGRIDGFPEHLSKNANLDAPASTIRTSHQPGDLSR